MDSRIGQFNMIVNVLQNVYTITKYISFFFLSTDITLHENMGIYLYKKFSIKGNLYYLFSLCIFIYKYMESTVHLFDIIMLA